MLDSFTLVATVFAAVYRPKEESFQGFLGKSRYALPYLSFHYAMAKG